MKYRGQEEKEFFPKHLIVSGPITDANYDLIKNQLKKAGPKQRQIWIGDLILRLIEDDRHSEYLITEDINTALEIFIENWSLLKVNRMCYGNEFGGAFEAYLNKYNTIPEVIS